MKGSWRGQQGVALVMVLLLLLVFLAVGAFVMLAVDRNTEMRAAYQRSVAGFHAAEAVVNQKAGDVQNTFLDFRTPECGEGELTINGRQVHWTLRRSGGQACNASPEPRHMPPDTPFRDLGALVYRYDLRAEARHRGETEAIVNMRFESYLIPMFQFAAFYKDDLELTVGPPMVINGRMHTNGNMYLNHSSCDLRILGNLTIVGDLFRGRKDDHGNYGKLRIALPNGSLRTLGVTGPSDESCPRSGSNAGTRRLIPDDEVALWQGRIRTDLGNIALPGQQDLLCAPWSCPEGQQPGNYWQKADVRIVLDVDEGRRRLSQTCPGAALPSRGRPEPALWPILVLDASGSVDAAKTATLCQLMVEMPGVITYTDVPTDSGRDCRSNSNCDGVYNRRDAYAEPFACRDPNDPLNGLRADHNDSNYCNDYRYRGFYNWRESKPVLMLNIDWMALEEWNLRRPAGSRLFDPNDTTEGGLVIFLSVRGPKSRGANNYAVRIYDAQRLRYGGSDAGVAFASDVAFYVAGNFNCADPDENVLESASPMPCGPGGKRPASIVADTINVLSCGWMEDVAGDPWDTGGACRRRFNLGADERSGNWGDRTCRGGEVPGRACPYRPLDEKSTSGPSNGQTARRTVVNAAFLAGNDLTWCDGNDSGVNCHYPDYYSGGLENYPRFHECWAACNTGSNEYNGRFWYEGSLVALEYPKHTCWGVRRGFITLDDPEYSCRTYDRQGFWSMQRYSPPQRRWFYDVSFDDAANLPPLSPRFVFLAQNFFTEESR